MANVDQESVGPIAVPPLGQLEEKIRSAQDEAYRLEARIWALSRVNLNLDRERVEAPETPLVSDRAAGPGPDPAASEKEQLIAALVAARRAALDEISVMRADLATLLTACGRLQQETSALSGRARDDERGVSLLQRSVVDLNTTCRQMQQFLDSLQARFASETFAAAPAAPRRTGQPTQTAEEAVAASLQRARQLRDQLVHLRMHISHWDEVRAQMKTTRAEAPRVQVAGTLAPVPSAVRSRALTAEVLLLDDTKVGNETARRLTDAGYLTHILHPSGELDKELRERPIISAAVNLAMPDGWGAARRIRGCNWTPRARLYAYALAPGAMHGSWLGGIDFLFLSVNEEEVVDIVRRLAPAGRRAIDISDQGLEEASGIRERLRAADITVEAAHDPAGVIQTLGSFTPDVALVHLSPRCFEVFEAIGALRSVEKVRGIPLLFLVEPDADPRDVAFFSAGLRLLSERERLEAAQIVNLLSFNLKLNAHRPQ